MTRLLNPDLWWDAIEPRLDDRWLLFALLALSLAGSLVIAAACEIGIRHLNTDWNYAMGYAVQRNRGWRPFLVLWAALVSAPILQGLIGVALLKIYSRQRRRWLRGVAVAIIGSIPMYVAGPTLVLVPGILLFAIAFLISCGWWASGSRRLLGVGYSESLEHVAVTVAISGGIMLLFTAGVPL